MRGKLDRVSDKSVLSDIKHGEAITILERFIKEKYLSYIEPQRKGTPKGDPIGLSKQKYHAALLMMTRKKSKDTARIVGVSYQMLRKWKTEKIFKENATKLCKEFARLAFASLRDMLQQEINYECRGWKEFKSSKPEINLEDFLDAKLYSPQLKYEIMDLVGLSIFNYVDARVAVAIRDVIEYSMPNALDATVRATQQVMIAELMQLVDKSDLPGSEKERYYKIINQIDHSLMMEGQKA